MPARAWLNVRIAVALLIVGLSLSLAGCVVPPSPAPTSGIQPQATSLPSPTLASTASPGAPTRPGPQQTPVTDVQIQITGKTSDQTITPRHVVRVPVTDSPLQVSIHYPGPVEADIDAVRTVQPTTVRWRIELVGGGDPNTLSFGLTGDQPGLVTLEINAAGYAPVRFSVALEASGTPVAESTPAASGTAFTSPATAMVSTAVPSVGSLPAQAGTPAAGATLTSPQSVTLADDGATITMHSGERFVLALGEEYDWTVTTADPAVVSRVVNILTVRGSQGVYEAHQNGHTTLTATGNPVCLKSQPPCGAPSRLFRIQIIVQ